MPIPCALAAEDWGPHQEQNAHNGCSALLRLALDHVRSKGQALDLGAGGMNDSLHLLKTGFEKVTAVDASPSSSRFAEAPTLMYGRRFEFCNARFSEFSFQEESADLVHANFSLPYHGKVGFSELMRAVTESARVGGVCSAILFGNKDTWSSTMPELPFFSGKEIPSLFPGFDILHLREIELDAQDKFWHYFQVIARRVTPVL